MIPTSVRQSMCSNKKRYPTMKAAIHAAITSSITFGKAMRPYKCPLCGGYHNTSQIH